MLTKYRRVIKDINIAVAMTIDFSSVNNAHTNGAHQIENVTIFSDNSSYSNCPAHTHLDLAIHAPLL